MGVYKVHIRCIWVYINVYQVYTRCIWVVYNMEQTIETKTFTKRLLSCSIMVNASKVVTLSETKTTRNQ